jgi:asparagine synthase (glutamine-hydrolysing)
VRHVTVALGGDGGDELFAGYDVFRALRWAELYCKLMPRPVHRAISMVVARLPVSHRNMSLDFKLKRALRGLDHGSTLWCPVWMAPLGPSDLEQCFREPVHLEDVYSEAIEQWESCRSDNLVDRTLQFYTKLYLPRRHSHPRSTVPAWMHSLEVRAPFLDIDLVNFVRHIPWRYKFRDRRNQISVEEGA